MAAIAERSLCGSARQYFRMCAIGSRRSRSGGSDSFAISIEVISQTRLKYASDRRWPHHLAEQKSRFSTLGVAHSHQNWESHPENLVLQEKAFVRPTAHSGRPASGCLGAITSRTHRRVLGVIVATIFPHSLATQEHFILRVFRFVLSDVLLHRVPALLHVGSLIGPFVELPHLLEN
jgi:hypothetical protein